MVPALSAVHGASMDSYPEALAKQASERVRKNMSVVEIVCVVSIWLLAINNIAALAIGCYIDHKQIETNKLLWLPPHRPNDVVRTKYESEIFDSRMEQAWDCMNIWTRDGGTYSCCGSTGDCIKNK